MAKPEKRLHGDPEYPCPKSPKQRPISQAFGDKGREFAVTYQGERWITDGLVALRVVDDSWLTNRTLREADGDKQWENNVKSAIKFGIGTAPTFIAVAFTPFTPPSVGGWDRKFGKDSKGRPRDGLLIRFAGRAHSAVVSRAQFDFVLSHALAFTDTVEVVGGRDRGIVMRDDEAYPLGIIMPFVFADGGELERAALEAVARTEARNG